MKKWNGSEKEVIRRDHTGRRNKHYTSVLDLSGVNCYSIRQFLDNGMIDQTTDLVVLEREVKLVPTIKTVLSSLGFQSFRVIHSDVTDWEPDTEFDFVNLDLCGSFSIQVLDWLGKVRFMNDADLSLNTIAAFRGTRPFIEQIRQASTSNPLLVEEVMNRQAKSFNSYNEDDYLPLIALSLAMNKWDFQYQTPVCYNDSTMMRIYNLHGINPSEDQLPDLDDFVDGQVASYTPKRYRAGNGGTPRPEPETVTLEIELSDLPKTVRLLQDSRIQFVTPVAEALQTT